MLKSYLLDSTCDIGINKRQRHRKCDIVNLKVTSDMGTPAELPQLPNTSISAPSSGHFVSSFPDHVTPSRARHINCPHQLVILYVLLYIAVAMVTLGGGWDVL